MASHRRGAALIMAIVILSGLLMLGLPFLFSQSASLSGTRTFAHSQVAQVGVNTAEDIGIGALATSIGYDVFAQQGRQSEYSSFEMALSSGKLPLIGKIPQQGPRRLHIDLSPKGHGWNPSDPRQVAIIGISLEDETGKLDPNHMDVQAWGKLFEKTGIADWDDGDDGPDGRLDDDEMGQLAYALAAARYDLNICPEGRITRFEQLLEVIPQPPGIRWPLTRSELAQIRPYLTFANLGQGREGLIDIGTMIRYTAAQGQGGSNTNTTLDTLHPSDIVGFPVARDLIGAGSVVVSDPPGRQGNAGNQRQQTSKYFYGMATSMDLATIPTGNPYPKSYRPKQGDAVAVESPGLLNIHEASEPVRWVMKGMPNTFGNRPDKLSEMDQLNTQELDALNRKVTGLMLQNPLGYYGELGSATVEETRPTDPGHGLEGNPPMSDGTLTASARCIHISASGGSRFNQLPKRGYARIESASTDPNETNPVVEFISYDGGLPTNGSRATLWNVRRGLSFPRSTGAQVHQAGGATKITIIAPRELPPLGITTQGSFTVESGSSVADAAGKQNAQQFRRSVVQAVPQEVPLEMRWERQSQFHALIVQRHGSLMNAFPKAYQRLLEKPPEGDKRPVNINDLDENTGVRPATLRTILTGNHLGTNWRNGHEWSRSFNQEWPGDNPLTQGDMEYPAAGGGYTEDDLTPEGLTLRAGSPLRYDIFNPNGNNSNSVRQGFFTYPLSTNFSPPINGRQFGLWIKPNRPISGDVTLFEVRSPQQNAGKRFAARDPWLPLVGNMDPREPGDNYYQNRITLQYEDATKQLVLTIANGAIEHLVDHGPITPSETFDFPSGGMFPPSTPGPYVDPRSLGNESVPGITPGVNPIGAKRPFNLVQHRYQLDKSEPFKANMWHLIQIAFVGNDPGHMSITVNGIAGREMTKETSIGSMNLGDHVTLPSLVLRTALPAANADANSASLLLIPSIQLDAIAVDPASKQMVTGAAAISALLPKRGMIRVHNEYISYDDIQGTTLVNCIRARRQDTIVGLPNRPDIYPQLESHLAGSLVVPGGIRLNPGGRGELWRGGCSLAEELPNGDPMKNFEVWAELTTPKTIDMTTGLPVLLDTDLIINVQNGVIDQWPSRGFARIDKTGEIIYYDNNGSKPTMQLLNVQRGQMGTMPTRLVWPMDPSMTQDYTISLISFEVTGDPTGRYPQPPAMPMPGQQNNPMLVQIMDANTGRVEWISYSNIDVSKGASFFIANNLYYFDPAERNKGRRGRQRTSFAGADIPGAPMFPPNSRVIPVQTGIRGTHILETGDVLTIVPKNPGPGDNGHPYQVCVRFVASDGVPTTAGAKPTGNNSWDTINGYFAFTEELEEHWPDGTFELMSYPGWSGNDLSKISTNKSNVSQPPFTMPLAAAFSPGYTLGSNAQITIGGDDTRYPFLQASNSQSFDGVVDAIYAGEQPGGTARNNSVAAEDNMVVGQYSQNSNAPKFKTDEIWLAAGANLNSAPLLELSNPIFYRDLGLVLIGGEVFAYERQHNPNNNSTNRRIIKLIGRGLLGSSMVEHVGPEPAVILPIGPVSRLTQSLGVGEQEVRLSNDWQKRYTQDEVNAPALMFCSPDGKQMELFAMPNRHTAKWLRGMYNTTVKGGWGPQNGLDTLVIGWWPRYPSGHPNQASQAWGSQNERNALLRCRMYAWMGFPIRFHDTYFTGGNGLADITLLSDGEGTYNVTASALTEGFDWNGTLNNSVDINQAGGVTDASAVYSQYTDKAVDGAEIRVRFEYRNPPADSSRGIPQFLKEVAINGNTAPMIGKTILRARAPTKVISVEEAR